MTDQAPQLHPAAESLSFLVGVWRGTGDGGFPTVAPFAYGEEVIFGHLGKPFLTYSQRTWGLADHRPLHTESGFLRALPGGLVELVAAHPTGHVEVAEGTVEGTRLTLRSTQVVGTTTAKEVRTVLRQIEVKGEELRYRLDMEAVGHGLEEHLRATLHRLGEQ